MVQPINYTALQTDPNAALMQGIKTGLTLETIGQERQQQQLAQQAAQQQQQASLLMQRVLSDPNATASDYGAISAINPKFTESIKAQWDRLDTSRQQQSLGDASKLFSALQAGRPDVALQSVETQLKAAENSGDTMRAQQFKAMRDMIQQAPDYARTIIGSTIAATPGGDKYFTTLKTLGEEGRAAAKAPAELLKATVEARYADSKAKADIANTLSQIEERGGRLGLDRDKFNLEFDTTLNKLQQGGGAPALSAGMEKLQAESVGNSITAKTVSDKASGLATALREADAKAVGKPGRWLIENSKRITGNENAYTGMRQEYVRLRNQGLLSDLPPGPASDKDIGLMKDGFPSEDQSPEYIANWLDSFSKVQKAVAQKEEAKAEWISSVGALRNTPKDIDVMGVRVPSGMSFTEFVRKGIKPEAAAQGAPATPGAAPAGQPRYLQYGK